MNRQELEKLRNRNWISNMNNILSKYAKLWGYTPTTHELWALYTQGELMLSDKEESILLKTMGR